MHHEENRLLLRCLPILRISNIVKEDKDIQDLITNYNQSRIYIKFRDYVEVPLLTLPIGLLTCALLFLLAYSSFIRLLISFRAGAGTCPKLTLHGCASSCSKYASHCLAPFPHVFSCL